MSLYVSNVVAEQKLTLKTWVTVPSFTAVSANGTLSLDGSSSTVHFLTGSGSGFSVVLPTATTVAVGTNFELYNRTASNITVKYSDGSTLGILSPESVSSLILQDNSTPKGIFSPFNVEIAQAAGIANYSASATTAFTTSSTTYVPITGFSVTPSSGNYAVFFNASCTNTSNNANVSVALYRNGQILADSERTTQTVANNFVFQTSTLGIASFDGTQPLEVYVKTTGGTLTVNARTGVALRLGAQV